ncbi:MAG: hypothetical protein VW450_08570 [Chloroflexota bacterium]
MSKSLFVLIVTALFWGISGCSADSNYGIDDYFQRASSIRNELESERVAYNDAWVTWRSAISEQDNELWWEPYGPLGTAIGSWADANYTAINKLNALIEPSNIEVRQWGRNEIAARTQLVKALDQLYEQAGLIYEDRSLAELSHRTESKMQDAEIWLKQNELSWNDLVTRFKWVPQ